MAQRRLRHRAAPPRAGSSGPWGARSAVCPRRSTACWSRGSWHRPALWANRLRHPAAPHMLVGSAGVAPPDGRRGSETRAVDTLAWHAGGWIAATCRGRRLGLRAGPPLMIAGPQPVVLREERPWSSTASLLARAAPARGRQTRVGRSIATMIHMHEPSRVTRTARSLGPRLEPPSCRSRAAQWSSGRRHVPGPSVRTLPPVPLAPLSRLDSHEWRRRLGGELRCRSGVIIGAAFAFLTTILVLDSVAKAETTTVNGWSSIRKAGQPGNGLLVRAALQKALPLVNVFEEAAYWTTSVDRAGKKLSGDHAYRLHFPSGHLPPNDAFWSLTATDTVGYMVSSPMGRSSVDDHSGLVTNRMVR